MPAVVTTISSGASVMNADLQGNLDAIETFLKGGMTGADLNEIQQFSVPRNELLLIGGFSGNDELPIMDPPQVVDDDTLHKLDTEGQWDFHMLSYLHLSRVEAGLTTFPRERIHAEFLNERMGDVPFPIGHAYTLNRCPFSWNDWRYAIDEPGTYTAAYSDDPGPDPKRPTDEYWTMWKTVPGCSDVIYVPEKGNLYITAFARGTFNCALRGDWFSGPPGAGDPPDPPGNFQAPNAASARSAYPSIEFRLIVEARGNKNKFDWNANGRAFRANWAPVTDPAEVAIDNTSGINVLVGHSAGTQSWPRADVILHGSIHLPGEGWYVVSMKLNNRYWYGYDSDDEVPVFVEGFYKNNEDIDDAGDVDASVIGPMVLCRWEAARMQTMFQPIRTELSDTATHVDFYPQE